jgi:hypothetical protein
MNEFSAYLIPALVALALATATAWVVYVKVVQRKPRNAGSVESKGEQPPIVVPTEQQLRETFVTWQQGGKEGLVRLLEERQRQSEQAVIGNEGTTLKESEPKKGATPSTAETR